jgi:hypothetical protein
MGIFSVENRYHGGQGASILSEVFPQPPPWKYLISCGVLSAIFDEAKMMGISIIISILSFVSNTPPPD